MGTLSLWHWLIVLIVALILFGGRGRISSIMADIGKGFKSFKNELEKDENEKK
jgi:sec-independent protein translocase protein TatA